MLQFCWKWNGGTIVIFVKGKMMVMIHDYDCGDDDDDDVGCGGSGAGGDDSGDDDVCGYQRYVFTKFFFSAKI